MCLFPKIAKYQRERDLLRRVLDNFEPSQTEIEVVYQDRLPPLELLAEEGEVNPYVVIEDIIVPPPFIPRPSIISTTTIGEYPLISPSESLSSLANF